MVVPRGNLFDEAKPFYVLKLLNCSCQIVSNSVRRDLKTCLISDLRTMKFHVKIQKLMLNDVVFVKVSLLSIACAPGHLKRKISGLFN